MKKRMSRAIVLVLFCLLIMLGLSSRATATPPPCPDCHFWNGDYCEYYGNCDAGCPNCESCLYCYCECNSECCSYHDCEAGQECVDCECKDKVGHCNPNFTLTRSGECWCYAFECGGSITDTFNWFCEEQGDGCPWGMDCVEVGTEDCYTSKTAECIGDCLAYGSECELDVWVNAPKAPRVICGCRD